MSTLDELAAHIVDENHPKETGFTQPFPIQDFQTCLLRQNEDSSSANRINNCDLQNIHDARALAALTGGFSVPLPVLCQQGQPQNEVDYSQISQLEINEHPSESCYNRHVELGQNLVTADQSDSLSETNSAMNGAEVGYSPGNMNNVGTDTSSLLQALFQVLQMSMSGQNSTMDEASTPRSCASPLVHLDHFHEVQKPSCSFANPDVNNSLNFSCRLAVPNQVFLPNTPASDVLASPPHMMTFSNISAVIDMLVNRNTPQLCSSLNESDGCASNVDKTPKVPAKFCAECNLLYTDHCAHHNTVYKHVEDSEVLSRARMSVPSCLFLQESFVEPSCTGVWTHNKVSQHTKFGPFIGVTSEPSENEDVPVENKNKTKPWKIFTKDKFLKLETSDENQCNWMMFIQPARTGLEQNVIMYQEDEDIFAVTCSDIEPNQELLFWYCKDYAVKLGVPVKPIAFGGAAQCHVCKQHFPDKKTMISHRKKMHPEISKKKLSCTECDKKFATLSKLENHSYSHTGLKPLKCPHCIKRFSEQGNLNKHLLIHLGVKKFACHICNQRYRQRAHLESHILCHTGEKSLQCPHCERKFARKSDLRSHMFMHTNERVFDCRYCPRIFHKKQNLERHEAIHIGDKKHRCSICSKAFLRKYHLVRHEVICEKKNGSLLGVT